MSIAMAPFRALYGYDALSFVDLVISDNRVPFCTGLGIGEPGHHEIS